MIRPEQQFLEHLLSGERVLWVGKPEKVGLYQGWEFIAIPIWGWVIPFSAALIYSGIEGLTKDYKTGNFMDTWLPILLGVIFLPAGFYGAFWRYVIRKRKINRTFYAVTEKRLLMLSVKSRGKNKELQLNCQPKELYLDSIKSIDTQINKEGTGTLIFSDGKKFLLPKRKEKLADLPEGGREPWGYSDNTFAFCNIKEARKVYEIIEKIRSH